VRILLISHHLPPEHHAGTEIYTYNLGLALVRAGHEVFLFSRGVFSDWQDYYVDFNYKDGMHILKINKKANKSNFNKTYSDSEVDIIFNKLLKFINPDLVHINHLLHLSFGLVTIIKNNNIPMVMTLHDYWLFCSQIHLHKNFQICQSKNNHDCAQCIFKQGYENNYNLIIKRDIMAKKIIEMVDIFISPSLFIKNKFIDMFGVSQNKIIHLPNGLKKEDKNIVSNEKSISDKIRLGYFSNIDEAKGLNILLQAYSKISHEKFDLIIYGMINRNYGLKLDQFYPQWRDYYHGSYDNQQVNQLISENIDVLVFPSIIYENYPTVVNEALANVKPVIASNAGGTIELIRSGQNGYLFENLNSEDLAKKINQLNQLKIEKMRQYIIKHPPTSFSSHLLSLQKVYKNILKKSIKKQVVFDQKKISQKINKDKNQIWVQGLYYDLGDGFKSNQVFYQNILRNEKKFKSTYNLSSIKNIKKLRFDPLEENHLFFDKLKLNIINIKVFDEYNNTLPFDIKLIESNCSYSNRQNFVFKTIDPQIIFPASGEIKKVVIEGEIEILSPIIEKNSNKKEIHNHKLIENLSLFLKKFKKENKPKNDHH